MKMIKCRKPATCEICNTKIEKGDLYGKKTKRLGSPGKQTVEMIEGYPTCVSHGFTYTIKLCESCA